MKPSIKAFTLVELAIVMTIIGLLIGGVLKGQELLENSRLTALGAQIKSYTSASITFRDIYKALPGDIIGPANFIQNCTTAPCNVSGDANGYVGTVNTFSDNENLRYWMHLGKAGLINGINTNATWSTVPALDSGIQPRTPIGGLVSIIYYNIAPDASFLEGAYNHWYRPLGVGTAVNPSWPVNVIAKYDLKVDDGQPWRGSVMLMANCGIANGATNYDPNNVTICHPGIKAEF